VSKSREVGQRHIHLLTTIDRHLVRHGDAPPAADGAHQPVQRNCDTLGADITSPILYIDGYISEKDSEEPEPALGRKVAKRTRDDTRALIASKRAAAATKTAPDSADIIMGQRGDFASSKRKRANPKSK
jgi:hypothetical protein